MHNRCTQLTYYTMNDHINKQAPTMQQLQEEKNIDTPWLDGNSINTYFYASSEGSISTLKISIQIGIAILQIALFTNPQVHERLRLITHQTNTRHWTFYTKFIETLLKSLYSLYSQFRKIAFSRKHWQSSLNIVRKWVY